MATRPVCALCLAIPVEIFRRRRKTPTEDCCYQHYSGSDALMAMSSSSRQGCLLCSILWFSLEASRQLLSRSTHKTPKLPERLPTETGITLHSFDDNHFIVRDDIRWSLVRFSEGNHVNEKGFLLHENANDEGVFALIKDWISQCTKHHPSCTIYRLNSSPDYVPARLIHISQDQGQFRLWLCCSDGSRSDGGKDYVALSHCWGSNPELVPRTTTANLWSRIRDIPWGDLTKTFQDAMETTSKLGISYIWIDSLCIVQDDSRDLEVHCESMSQIYSNSFCTISATGAMDGTEGCFMPRNNVEMHPCVIRPAVPPEITEESSNPQSAADSLAQAHVLGPSDYDNSDYDRSDYDRSDYDRFDYDRFDYDRSDYDRFDYDRFDYDRSDYDRSDYDRFNYDRFNYDSAGSKEGKGQSDQDETGRPYVFTVLPTFREWTYSMKGHLLSRGWTLQERELSVRVLHFTSDRVVWECRQCYASEDDPTLKAKYMRFDVGLKFRLLDGSVRDRKDRSYNYKFSKWMDLAEEYSMRKLSIKDDKLRAIAGLADAIKSIQQDDVYLSGLWKRDLATELLWYAIPNPEHSDSPGSWPPEPVTPGIPTWSWAAYDGAVVFDRSLRGKESVCIQEARSSWITLSGSVFNVPFSEAERDSSEVGVNQNYKWPRDNSGYQIYITLDANPEGPRELELICLVLNEIWPGQLSGQSRTSLPTYSQSSSGSNTQHIPRRIWDGDRSATGLVLLPIYGSTYTHGCNNLPVPKHIAGATATYRRVGIFNAMGCIPVESWVEVNIV